jgi:hypothetical protein
MRLWTFMGIGTHFALAYLLLFVGYWWPPALALYFILCATLLNLALAVFMILEARSVRT